MRRCTILAGTACLSMPLATALAVRTTKRLALIDRDGVINEDVGSPGVTNVGQLRLTPGAGRAIGRLKRAGWYVAMVTNQSCVGKGIIDERRLYGIQQTVRDMLAGEDADATIDRIYQCKSTKESNDPRMKPRPGMLLEALRDFDMFDHTDRCCFIGDTSTDLEAAASAGIERRILVSTGYGSGLMGDAVSLVRPSLSDQSKGSCSDGPTGPATVISDARQLGRVRNTEHEGDANSSANIDDSSSRCCGDVRRLVPSDTDIHPTAFPFWYCRNLDHAVGCLLAQDRDQLGPQA